MYLTFLFLFSPLEQFEISSYTTSLQYIATYPLELFEKNFLLFGFQNTFNFTTLFFFISIFFFLQTNLKHRGFLALFLFVYIILVNINVINFTEYLFNFQHINLFLENMCRKCGVFTPVLPPEQ
jgi:hypothetical protein